MILRRAMPGTSNPSSAASTRIGSRPRIDPAVRAARQAHCVMTFRIYRDGTVKDMQITQGSGNVSMDNSAQRALLSSNPMPPLPSDYPAPFVDVTFDFDLGFNSLELCLRPRPARTKTGGHGASEVQTLELAARRAGSHLRCRPANAQENRQDGSNRHRPRRTKKFASPSPISVPAPIMRKLIQANLPKSFATTSELAACRRSR